MVKKLTFFPLIGGGKSLFSPISCHDVSKTLLLASEKKGLLGNLYYIANQESVNFREFISYIADACDKKFRPVPFPVPMARIIATGSERMSKNSKREPKLTRFRVDFFTRNHVYDTESLIRDINPQKYKSIREVVNETVNWYRAKNLI
jgi:nucleoside-diphosphate-sugar epimerase